MSVDNAKPPRPHLPPVLLAGLALWAVTALWWPWARALDEGILVGTAAAGSAVAVLVFARGLRRKRVVGGRRGAYVVYRGLGGPRRALGMHLDNRCEGN